MTATQIAPALLFRVLRALKYFGRNTNLRPRSARRMRLPRRSRRPAVDRGLVSASSALDSTGGRRTVLIASRRGGDDVFVGVGGVRARSEIAAQAEAVSA